MYLALLKEANMKSFYTQLPKPLSKEEIHECFEKYRLGDLNARKKL